MADEINDLDGQLEQDSAGRQPQSAAAGLPDGAPAGAPDPNDEIPVPEAMWPSEIDERAQVVEALRGNAPPPRTDTQIDPTDPRADRME